MSFELAQRAFGDPFLVAFPDPLHSAEEERFLMIGAAARGTILVCSYTERDPSIRIIMARRATSREVKYSEQTWQR